MNVFYDAFCGTLHGKDAGANQTSSSVYSTIPKLVGNTRYVFTLPLETLTITEVENSPFESEIFFTASPNGITVTFPSTLDVAGEIAFEAGCRYLLRVRSNVAFLSEISNAAEEATYSATPHNLTSNTSDPRFTLSSSSDKYEDVYDEENGTYDYVIYQAWNAMDADSSNLAQSTSDEYSCWWKICFNEGLVNLRSIYVEDLNMQAVLEGSFDDAAYTEIRRIPGGTGTYKINTVPYQYYRLRSPENSNYYALSVREIELKYRLNTMFVKLDPQSFRVTEYSTCLPIEAYGTDLTFEATGLPDGLAIDSNTGEITGTFPNSSPFTFQVTVTNALGISATAQMTVSRLATNTSDITVYELTTVRDNQSYNITSIKGGATILWGDGTETQCNTGTSGYSHIYKKPGVYKIVLAGPYTGFALGLWIPSGDHAGKYITSIIKVSNNLTDAINTTTPMFGGLERITSMPFFNTSTFTCFEHMFLRCTALRSAPAFSTANVTSFKQVFDTCSNLTAIPAWDFSKSVSFDRSFQNCTALTGTANAASFWENPTVNESKHGGCFKSCTKLSNYASIPSDWK